MHAPIREDIGRGMKTFLVALCGTAIGAVLFMLGVWTGSVQAEGHITHQNRFEIHESGIPGMLIRLDKVTGETTVVGPETHGTTH